MPVEKRKKYGILARTTSFTMILLRNSWIKVHTSPDSSRPPIVPCDVSAPSANLDTIPHSSALRGPTALPTPSMLLEPFVRDISVEEGTLLIVGGICERKYLMKIRKTYILYIRAGGLHTGVYQDGWFIYRPISGRVNYIPAYTWVGG